MKRARVLRRLETRRAIVHWYSGPMDAFHELARVLGRSTAALEARVPENFLAPPDGDARLLEPFERAVRS